MSAKRVRSVPVDRFGGNLKCPQSRLIDGPRSPASSPRLASVSHCKRKSEATALSRTATQTPLGAETQSIGDGEWAARNSKNARQRQALLLRFLVSCGPHSATNWPVRHSGINASPDAFVAKPASSAPKGPPQTSLGPSDQRERRPRLHIVLSVLALKGRNRAGGRPMCRPFRAGAIMRSRYPGRGPGLVCRCPFGAEEGHSRDGGGEATLTLALVMWNFGGGGLDMASSRLICHFHDPPLNSAHKGVVSGRPQGISV